MEDLPRHRYQGKRPSETSPGAVFRPEGTTFGNISAADWVNLNAQLP